jgi:hypothetical protein
MADIKWKASGRATNPLTLMSTELNSLASGSGAIGAAIVNETDHLDLYVDLELVVAFVASPTADSVVEAYFARQIDGTNYEDAATGGTPIGPKNGFVGSFVMRAVTPQRVIIPSVLVPPRDFKVFVINRAGQAFAASGNTVKGYFYKEQTV